ncbi:MAG TPA: lantibiotic dehydratase [Streptosporangiaceae bacterium]|nr:lantibiotic dehydratase [Streptosporangiaceae bacterium]
MSAAARPQPALPGPADYSHEAVSRASREIRAALANQMTAASVTERYPITIDLRLDGRLMLPAQVARRAEAALAVLATISAHPFGTPAWQDYHTRFFDRYGAGRFACGTVP